jgi:hypothetical protein
MKHLQQTKQNALKNEMFTFVNILFSEMQYVFFCFFSYDILWVFNKYHMNFFWMNKKLLIFTSCSTLKLKHLWNNGPSRLLILEIHYCHWVHYFKNTPTFEHYPSQNASKKCISQKINCIFQSWKHMNKNNAQDNHI